MGTTHTQGEAPVICTQNYDKQILNPSIIYPRSIHFPKALPVSSEALGNI